MTTPNNLGKLERVELREIWKTEDRDFTPWLASEENISILADTIGIDLEVEAQEKDVGPFRADILCKDTSSDSWVLIENQLEKTNHRHLGQLMTYAAGLDAVTIVWIADRFTDEHRAAMDWLNRITDGEFNFFGLEVELWRIADSPIAPKFNIISKPNEWSLGPIPPIDITETKQLQLEFWTHLWKLLKKRGSSIRGTKPRPQSWNSFSIGRSKIRMFASVNTQKNFLQVGITLKGPHKTAHFQLLHDQMDNIESELAQKLEWEELPNRKESRIAIRNFDFDPTKQSDWLQQHKWMAENLENFDKVFRPRIKNLSVDQFAEDENGEED